MDCDVMISCFSSNVVKSYHTADIFCLTSTSLDAKQDPKSEQFFRLASLDQDVPASTYSDQFQNRVPTINSPQFLFLLEGSHYELVSH